MNSRCMVLKLLLAIVALSVITNVQSYEQKRIIEVTPTDVTLLERQRGIIGRLVRENFGHVNLEGSTAELYYLQKIIDKQLVHKNEIYDLQALGVVFGDVMVKNLNLSWVVVEDRYGRSRALRFEDSDELFFPITMISRRAKMDKSVNVRALYRQVEESVNQLTYKRSLYKPLPRPKF